MFGHIFVGFENFVTEKYGTDTWAAIHEKAGIEPNSYRILHQYPDEEIISLIAALAAETGETVNAIWRDVGKFMASFFVGMYKVFFKPGWGILDLFEHIETTVHSELRLYNPGLNPPELGCKRVSDNEIIIHYSSPRKMCAFAIGMIEGFADHYDEEISIHEKECMLNNDTRCDIYITRTSLHNNG